jgi:hypothetical protein
VAGLGRSHASFEERVRDGIFTTCATGPYGLIWCFLARTVRALLLWDKPEPMQVIGD